MQRTPMKVYVSANKTNKCILHDSHRAVLYMHMKKELEKK